MRCEHVHCAPPSSASKSCSQPSQKSPPLPALPVFVSHSHHRLCSHTVNTGSAPPQPPSFSVSSHPQSVCWDLKGRSCGQHVCGPCSRLFLRWSVQLCFDWRVWVIPIYSNCRLGGSPVMVPLGFLMSHMCCVIVVFFISVTFVEKHLNSYFTPFYVQ